MASPVQLAKVHILDEADPGLNNAMFDYYGAITGTIGALYTPSEKGHVGYMDIAVATPLDGTALMIAVNHEVRAIELAVEAAIGGQQAAMAASPPPVSIPDMQEMP